MMMMMMMIMMMPNVMKCQMSMSIYDSKQKRPALHTSERTIVPRTVIFDVGSALSPHTLLFLSFLLTPFV